MQSGFGYLHFRDSFRDIKFRSGRPFREVVYRHRRADIEDNDLDPDEGIVAECKACSLPIFSTPFTVVSNKVYELDVHGNRDSNTDRDGGDGDHYFLHKCCANLPKELKPESHPNSALVLNPKLPPQNVHYCSECISKREGFFYECPDIECHYSLDVLCAMPIGTIKIKHPSHNHDLVPVLREFSSNCRACGTTAGKSWRDRSFMCNLSHCKFWIHWHCSWLPNTIRHRKHHFDQQHLLYLHYTRHRAGIIPSCFLCSKNVDLDGYACYNCTRCEAAAHVECATSDPHSFKFVRRRDAIRGLAHFPMADEHKSAISYLLEHTNALDLEEAPRNGEMKMFAAIHKHPLMFHDHFPNQGDPEEALIPLCNVCVDPISPPFYSCPLCNDFLVHRCCSNLPKLSHALHICSADGDVDIKPYTLDQRSVHSPLDGLWNFSCYMFSNAAKYSCESCPFLVDVGCAFLPRAITHKAHCQTHILTPLQGKSNNYVCVCCNLERGGLGYECSTCNGFQIDAHCALLPMTVRHNFDRHPIKLIMHPAAFLSNDPNDDFCEICEETVDGTRWFYGCNQCNHIFHVGCIPSVNCGYSKFKFGGTIRVGCHDCPLTCIQMLTSYSYTCGLCNKLIQGRDNDEVKPYHLSIGFECNKCGYWMHFHCAKSERVEESRFVELEENQE